MNNQIKLHYINMYTKRYCFLYSSSHIKLDIIIDLIEIDHIFFLEFSTINQHKRSLIGIQGNEPLKNKHSIYTI